MKLKTQWILRIFVLLIAFLVTPVYMFSENVQKDRTAKEFYLKDLQSKKKRLSDFRGKVVVLNFFATWCYPCRQEIPELIKIYQQNKKKGLVVLGISLDAEESSFMLHNFVRVLKIPYPILIGTETVVEDYQIFGVPTTFVVNKEGKIYKRFDGWVPPMHFESALKDLLEKNPGS